MPATKPARDCHGATGANLAKGSEKGLPYRNGLAEHRLRRPGSRWRANFGPRMRPAIETRCAADVGRVDSHEVDGR